MKSSYSLSLVSLAVIITERARFVLSIPTPVFAPFTIAFQNANQEPQQRLPQAATGPQLRPVSEIFYAITRSPHDPPPSFAASPALDYYAGDQNQFAPSMEHAASLPVIPPPRQSVVAVHPPSPPPAQGPHLQAQQQGISGPPPMPSLPFHTVPATLPNKPPFEWHAATVQPTSQPVSQISSSTPSLQTLEPADTTLAPPLETADGQSVDGTTHTGRERPRKLSGLPIVGIVLGTLGGLTLLIFMLIDSRISRACRTNRLKAKGLGNRPISSWFPCPSSHQHHPVSRKAVSGQRRGLELENSENSAHASLATSCPRSKFSITSSDYDQMSRASMSTTDTVLVENTRANESIPPIRPPRPPTADSPATMSDSVFFAPENQIYLEPVCPLKEKALGSGDSTKREAGLPLGRPLIPPGAFFARPLASGSLSSTSTAVASATVTGGLSALQKRRHGVLGHSGGSSSGIGESDSGSESESRTNYNLINSGGLYSSLGLLQFGSTSDTLSTGEESRHSRRHSAPLFSGNPVHDSFQPVYMDPVARKVLKHRRSRSNSGWAYPRRTVANPSFQWSSESEESYHGAYGQAL